MILLGRESRDQTWAPQGGRGHGRRYRYYRRGGHRHPRVKVRPGETEGTATGAVTVALAGSNGVAETNFDVDAGPDAGPDTATVMNPDVTAAMDSDDHTAVTHTESYGHGGGESLGWGGGPRREGG